MIGGGSWNRQDKILNGAYINFVSKRSSGSKSTHIAPTPTPTPNPSVKPDVPVLPDGYIYLMDTSGAYLITSDDKYIIVKEI